MCLSNHKPVVILGAGISGLMCAYHLHQAGIAACVIERDTCGSGCSNAAGGILFPLKPWQYNPTLVQLILSSNIDIPQISSNLHLSTGIDAECINSGICFLDSNPLSQLNHCLQLFPVTMQIVQKNDTGRHLDYKPPTRFQSALHIEEIYQINPASLVAALRKYCQLNNIQIVEQCTAYTIKEMNNYVEIKTSKGSINTDYLVVTLGAWSQTFFEKNNISAPNVFPVKGQMIQFSPLQQPFRPIIVHNGYYLIPRSDGRVVAGSTLEYTGFDSSTSSAAREQIQQHALEACPALQNCNVERHWSGLRPGTDGNEPNVGVVPGHSRIWMNYGHHRYGFALSVSSAQTIVSSILSK